MSNGRPRAPSRAAIDRARGRLNAGDRHGAQRAILNDVAPPRNRERPGTRAHARRELDLALEDLGRELRDALARAAAAVGRRLRRRG